MSEEEKIKKSPQDGKSERPEEVTENISPQKIIEQTEAQIEINQLIFYLHERKSGFVGEIYLLSVQKQYAAALIQSINKECHLKDK